METLGDGLLKIDSSTLPIPEALTETMDGISPEADSWVNSCLTYADELPDNDDDWIALKAALLDAITSQPANLLDESLFTPQDVEHGEFPAELGSHDKKPSPDRDEVDRTYPSSYVDASRPSTSGRPYSGNFDEILDENEQELLLANKEPGTGSIHFRGKEYMLTNGLEDKDKAIEFVVPAISAEDVESTENIFKVWDLDTPDEEDELTKQLNKALEERSLATIPSLGDPNTALSEEKLDELVSELADLSLQSL